jgi:hypothetical protein
MPLYEFPDYDRKSELSVYSRTPLGVTVLLLRLLRERYSATLSGQLNGFNWKPPIGPGKDYKNTEIYIEKWGSQYSEVNNYCPAIIVKRAAFQYQEPPFYGKATVHSPSGATLFIGQMEGGVTVSCYSRQESECEILGNLTYEFFIRGREVIQKTFGLNMCWPNIFTEPNVTEDGNSPQGQKIYRCDIQIRLNFDFNHQRVPMAPLLKEISVHAFLKAEQAQQNSLIVIANTKLTEDVEFAQMLIWDDKSTP